MTIANKNLDSFRFSELLDLDRPLYIQNSTIRTLDFTNVDPEIEIIIENCMIENFLVLSCWFTRGLIFQGNTVMNYIDYQMGGHNKRPIIITGNNFKEFFNFFDCHFENKLEVCDNTFVKGTNLFGNLTSGGKNTFENIVKCDGNIGHLALDGDG